MPLVAGDVVRKGVGPGGVWVGEAIKGRCVQVELDCSRGGSLAERVVRGVVRDINMGGRDKGRMAVVLADGSECTFRTVLRLTFFARRLIIVISASLFLHES